MRPKSYGTPVRRFLSRRAAAAFAVVGWGVFFWGGVGGAKKRGEGMDDTHNHIGGMDIP